MTFDGMTMLMGMEPGLDNVSMVMFMMGDYTVTHSDGDFAVLSVRKGDLVDGPMMIMEEGTSMMGMGPEVAEVSIPSVPGWSWTESDSGPTFSSTGPNDLQITITGMTSGGGYAPVPATLTLEFFIDDNGFFHNSITLIAEPPGRQTRN